MSLALALSKTYPHWPAWCILPTTDLGWSCTQAETMSNAHKNIYIFKEFAHFIERHGLLEWFQRRSRGPEEGHKAGEPLLWRMTKRDEIVQPDEKVLGRLYRRLPVLTEGLQDWGSGGTFSSGSVQIRQGGMLLNLNNIDLDYTLGRNSLRGWWSTGCPEKLWLPHPHRCSRPDWMGIWSTWCRGRCLWLWQES